jgi:hypothetical protein
MNSSQEQAFFQNEPNSGLTGTRNQQYVPAAPRVYGATTAMAICFFAWTSG